MEGNIFNDKSNPPNDISFKRTSVKNYELWNSIKKILNERHGLITEEWKYYGEKSGWVLKYLYKKRNLFFLFVSKKYLTITFVFGEKAVKAVEKSDLPSNTINELISAKKYAEGRGIRIPVKKNSDIEIITKLVTIKIKH